ncbi:LysR family transcriptional regulator [Pseudomonas veronii]|uniref:LysR family transcriptional regulator n=2 Tax=Pseudomonas veronii TaxID=76761 RepID=A0ABS0VG31_PSEVE|nr:LysR family transcriptional regulator [Pseudomonas veronii]MBI6554488.1 LysR family transcriptional regulator [Pseudomonas veronii]MBI6649040.1 LysR family transcriptional regulator [Pseudomonas veronii]
MQNLEELLLDADLHSLITFLVVYQEGGVTRASERLGVKQPAISNTIAKLRKRFGDQLFLGRRAWIPTERADQLAITLRPAFHTLQEALASLNVESAW